MGRRNAVPQFLFCEQGFDVGTDVFYLFGRLVAFDHLPFLVDEELGEVPFDFGRLLVIGISLGKHLVENGGKFMTFIPTGKSFLFFEEFIERGGMFAVYFNLLKSWEIRPLGELAEFVNCLVGTRCLLTELVAGEIKNFEALGVVFLISVFQLGIGGGESTFGCCVNNEEHFVGILLE